MGTNFYLEEKPRCPTCGSKPEGRIHIGKSSGGWVFALNTHPDLGINDLPDWIDRWEKEGASIWNEYGEYLTPKEMLYVIMVRFWKRDEVHSPQFFANNGALQGPFNLLRSRIDGVRVIGHGAGTYDLHRGDFS